MLAALKTTYVLHVHLAEHGTVIPVGGVDLVRNSLAALHVHVGHDNLRILAADKAMSYYSSAQPHTAHFPTHRANRMHASRPIPLEPPVTMATLSANRPAASMDCERRRGM